MNRRLLIAMALVAGCGPGLPPVEPDCILADGTELVGGQTIEGDDCTACDARTGELRRVWGATCGSSRVFDLMYEGSGGPVSVSLGPDADGDGLGDVAIAYRDSLQTNRGSVRVLSSATFETIFEVEGERDQLAFYNVVLGPDVSGDGLADLLVSSANSILDEAYDDLGMFMAYAAPNPGLVVVYEPITGRELARWEGELPCQSLGNVAEMAPDADGDGLGEILIFDAGCGGPLFPDDPMREAVVEVRSGVSDRFLFRRAGFWESFHLRQPTLVVVEGQVRLGYTESRDIRHVDLSSGEVVLRALELEGPPSRPSPRLFGFDLTGDGTPDALASISPANLMPPTDAMFPVILLPDMQYPVSRYTLVSDARAFDVFPDADGDGRDDVLVQNRSAEGFRDFVSIVAPTGEAIYTVEDYPLPERPQNGRSVGAISRPHDMDGDGCSDFAVTLNRTDGVRVGINGFREVEIHRCAGW